VAPEHVGGLPLLCLGVAYDKSQERLISTHFKIPKPNRNREEKTSEYCNGYPIPSGMGQRPQQ
jgi:hypothetical protein